MRFYTIPDTIHAELDQFERDIADFVAGKIDPVKFKAIRVAHGVYEQRQLETYMIRIRCAAAAITPEQLKVAAEMGEKYGSGEVHFTTRQEIQVHDVLIENVMNVIRGLLPVGLSSRGGGGNTIRNILTSVDSGISKTEAFDVEPYAMALTTRMICEPDSWNLPRKFKIAFSNALDDSSYTQATCLGYVATVENGVKGFQVYCAGGMGAKPMVGHALLDFIPDTKVYQVAKAMKVMFDKHGNRRSKFSSRLKFLWKKLDEAEFKRLFLEEYNQIKDDESLNLELPLIENKAESTDLAVDTTVSGPDFEQWKERYVFEQKQAGLASVKIPLTLGDLLTADANALCDFLQPFGDNTIRCDRAQNIRLRNIPEQYLPNLFSVIKSLGHHMSELPPFLGNMINCTGAQTCKLGICLPRGLSTELSRTLSETDLDLDSITDFRLNMSGCPNTCGMHHIADLGFFGKAGRNNGDLYPMYNVLAGAKVGAAGETQYAQRYGELPVHRIPNFVKQFLGTWIHRKKDETYDSYDQFLESEGIDLIQTLCEEYKEIPSYDEDPSYYTDYGAKARLSMDELGSAECSAGLFDMIAVDQKSIRDQQKGLDEKTGQDKLDSLYAILFASARMLLVTRGLDAKDDATVFQLFMKHFAQTGLVSEDYLGVLELGKENRRAELESRESEILALAGEMNDLYKRMDDSLRFKSKSGEVIEEKSAESGTATATATKIDVEKDYRGVACPMNFVKTKLVLEPMSVGQTLKILLDDGEPIENVPNSVQLEGHKILEKEHVGPHWEVLILKQ